MRTWRQPPRPPHELVASVPPALSAIVLKLSGQGRRGALPERRGAEGRPGAVPGGPAPGRARGLRAGPAGRPHPLPAPPAALRARGPRPPTLLAGLRAGGARRQARAHPGPRLLRHRQVLGGPRAAQARGPAARLLPQRQVRSVPARTFPTPPWPRPSGGWCSNCSSGTDEELARWRERLREALRGHRARSSWSWCPSWSSSWARSPSVPELSARRGAAPLQPRLPPVPRRLRHRRAPARHVPG